jgi:hypothetical protein
MFENKIKRVISELKTTLRLLCKLSLLAAFFSPLTAFAQEAEKWEYRASIYGYLPDISGTTVFPAGGNSGVGLTSEQILSNLEFTFMGTFDMHNGRWGLFSDLVYFDIDASRSRTRDFTLLDGGRPISIPGSTTADLNLHFKATVWTMVGEYRVVSTPTVKMDVLAGTRMFKAQTNANWDITGGLGSWTGARTGAASVSRTFWDGIVGVKGNVVLGKSSPWSVPFYFDVGTGDTQLTWQAVTGISYAFSWGEASAMWRYLDYEMKSGSAFQDVNFSGPMIGATFKF